MSTIRCVALLTRKAVAMANQQSTDNTAQLASLLVCTNEAQGPADSSTAGYSSPRKTGLESESPVQHTLLHLPNNTTANQFRFLAAIWPTWATVLVA